MSWGFKKKEKWVNYHCGLTLPETRAGHFYPFSINMDLMRERKKVKYLSFY